MKLMIIFTRGEVRRLHKLKDGGKLEFGKPCKFVVVKDMSVFKVFVCSLFNENRIGSISVKNLQRRNLLQLIPLKNKDGKKDAK